MEKIKVVEQVKILYRNKKGLNRESAKKNFFVLRKINGVIDDYPDKVFFFLFQFTIRDKIEWNMIKVFTRKFLLRSLCFKIYCFLLFPDNIYGK